MISNPLPDALVAAAKLAISAKDEINAAVAWRLMAKQERSHLIASLPLNEFAWLASVVSETEN